MAERRAQELLELGVSADRIQVLYNRTREQPASEFLLPTLSALGVGLCIPNCYQTLNTAVLSGELAPAESPVGKACAELAKTLLAEPTAAGIRAPAAG